MGEGAGKDAGLNPGLPYFFERGQGPPLLLIHGLMMSGDMFATVIDSFAERHRVIVPDLRGHGRSRDMPPPYAVEQLAADLAALLDHLQITSAVVLGYSQGGAVAQQLVLDHPAKCRHLVLGCTYSNDMATTREKIEAQLAVLLVRVVGPRGMAWIGERATPELDADVRRSLTRIIAGQDRGRMIAAWQAMKAFDSRPRLAEIGCPTLIIAGSDDRAVPAHHANMLHEGIRGSQLAVVEGGGHTLIWTHAKEFLRLTEDFLASA